MSKFWIDGYIKILYVKIHRVYVLYIDYDFLYRVLSISVSLLIISDVIKTILCIQTLEACLAFLP